MEWIQVNEKNIDHEHICCSLSKNDEQVLSKKEWMKKEFQNGLVFFKANIRGKCFIEYMPLQYAYVPISGQNMMYINCFWVSGSYQGHGYARELFEKCRQDCMEKGMQGIVILAGTQKKAFVMDQCFLEHLGFISVERWLEYELMYYPLKEGVNPYFDMKPMQEDGLILYYTHQCPFHIKYVALLKDYCQQHHISLKTYKIENSQQAKQMPTPFPQYSLFYQKKFITREVLTSKKFEKIWRNLNE